MPNTLRTRKSKVIGQGKPRRNTLEEWFKSPQGCDSLWACQCVYPHLHFFPPDKHIVSFTTFHLYVEIHFYKADKPGSCPWWSSGSDSALSLQWPDLNLWSGTKILHQAPTGWGHLRSALGKQRSFVWSPEAACMHLKPLREHGTPGRLLAWL